MAQERIGFVGLGLMGHGMAKNIVEKGYPLTVTAHRNRAPVDDLVSKGAHERNNPMSVAKESDLVIICVTGSPQDSASDRFIFDTNLDRVYGDTVRTAGTATTASRVKPKLWNGCQNNGSSVIWFQSMKSGMPGVDWILVLSGSEASSLRNMAMA